MTNNNQSERGDGMWWLNNSSFAESPCCGATVSSGDSPSIDGMLVLMEKAAEEIRSTRRPADVLLLTQDEYEQVIEKSEIERLPAGAEKTRYPLESIAGLPIEVYPDGKSLGKRLAELFLEGKKKVAFIGNGIHEPSPPDGGQA